MSGIIGLPIGEFADGVSTGLGALLTLTHDTTPQMAVTGRLGFMSFSVEGSGVSLSNIPFWGGILYRLAPNARSLYLRGELGFNRLHASVSGLGSETEIELGMGVGVGTNFGKVTVDGALHVLSIDNASDSMMLGAAVGATF